MAAENPVIRGEAVILLKEAIMHSVTNIKEGQGHWRVFLLVATMVGGRGGGRGWSGQRAAAAKSGPEGRSTRTSSPTGDTSRPGLFRWPLMAFIPLRQLVEKLDQDQCTQRSDSPSLPFPRASRVEGWWQWGGYWEPRHRVVNPTTLPTCRQQLYLSHRSRHAQRKGGQ